MKNYQYKWQITDRGFAEVPESEFTDNQKDMNRFVESMSLVIKYAKCGWDGVMYKVMKHPEMGIDEYMVLHCDGGERWIPVSGNSKGCNFSVLGENIW